MSVLFALILGIIQGLTEFLPISSSGHLLLFEYIFGLKSGDMFFNVLLHFASLLAVVIVFWKDIVILIKNPLSNKTKNIIVATIPTVVIALFIKKFFNDYYLFLFLGFGFLISSFLIFISIMLRKRNKKNKILSKKESFVIGIVQGFAVLPGISRSGSTICAGLLQGVNREEAAKFSFLISIPIIIAAMIIELYDAVKIGFCNVSFLNCLVGFLSSFVVAIFSIKLMMKIVRKGNWFLFSVYLFVLSVFVILNQFVFCLF